MLPTLFVPPALIGLPQLTAIGGSPAADLSVIGLALLSVVPLAAALRWRQEVRRQESHPQPTAPVFGGFPLRPAADRRAA